MSDYVGSELELFAEAHRWKAYVREQVQEYLGAHVLEVGAGIGTTTRALCRGDQERWICLEPDRIQAARIAEDRERGALPSCCRALAGTLLEHESSLRGQLDSVLYMDVLEHIEDDRSELVRAAACLRPGGHLVVLAPAHAFLFSAFDAGVGHFRRYDRPGLQGVFPADGAFVRARYLDAVGLAASLANRFMLRASLPTPAQIALWDRVMVRTSTWIDPWLRFALGKSVLVVWRKHT